MASFVWWRHPQEAYDNPYEYGAQQQFSREAKGLLLQLRVGLNCFTMKYHKNDHSLEKATWMLAVDLNDTLLEILCLFEEKRHSTGFRLFRDIVETMDLLYVLHFSTPRAEKTLKKWYENSTIPHKDSRMYIQEIEGAEAAEKRSKYYSELSKFTHRTYLSLLNSYSLGKNNMLVNDSYSQNNGLILPQTIASGLAVLADLILQVTQCLIRCGALSSEVVENAWLLAIEDQIIPRRFSSIKSHDSYSSK